ncbi:MAG: TatD family hydrolase [Verrucomicrobia bacterium]|nr:TatD family hydrolase [Verrucomicrobiota bacterium]MCH8525681.1 TatD family hydrolase [Kiritimatiellia bacterium]
MITPDTGWTDAHCQLQEFIADGSLPEIRARAAAFNVTAFLVNGTSPDDWLQVASLADDPAVHPHFGLHPWFADRSDDWEPRLRDLLHRFPRAGIGEIGLDRQLTDTPYPRQLDTLRRQLILAQSLRRPCTLHAVGNVWDDLLAAVREHTPPAVLLHAWGGGTNNLKAWIDLGAYFSFGGALRRTPPSRKLEDTLRQIPPDRLLLETDAPWQDPRGKKHRSEPAQLPAVAEHAARIKNIPLETLRALTEQNRTACLRTGPPGGL